MSKKSRPWSYQERRRRKTVRRARDEVLVTAILVDIGEHLAAAVIGRDYERPDIIIATKEAVAAAKARGLIADDEEALARFSRGLLFSR